MIKSPPALGIQQQPWDQTANRIVGKAARRVLLLAAFGAAVALGYSLVAAPSGLSWWWVLIVPTSGIAMLAYTTAPSRKYSFPLLLSVFFFLGYVLVLARLQFGRADIPKAGFGSIGVFDLPTKDFCLSR